ncbi:flavin-containing monooxygenase [Nocardioides sp. MAHUQ-72]|uniref:flavin-containing monooxygenase n=1 Tax=unclassified Nocardioides TaxID=2615069 RepID=UPI0036206197
MSTQEGGTPEHVDVLVVGAGLSGIGAACRLRTEHPGRSVAILESRGASGGTWDLFRYPGIRSDSDMFTFGYRWRPWPGDQALADGASILDYVRTVAEEYAVDELVRYHHTVRRASWDSGSARWTVEVDTDEGPTTLTTSFLYACAGYYDYEQGYSPEFPGAERFTGEIVHPQAWPEDLDHTGKRVVVIGSGATAVTLVPAMAGEAEHVTMLQRSPSYVLSRPGRDPLARRLERLPTRLTFPVVRWKAILLAVLSFTVAQRRPDLARKLVRRATAEQLPPGVDVDVHFNPAYNPWDQRLCFVPDGDLFRALRNGTASVVTDHVETFTEKGILLRSGEELEADVIVTATGLNLRPMGGIDLEVDGRKVDVAETMTYRTLMLSDVPNFAFTIGYTNNSWTLKADLVADYVCRLLAHLDRTGTRTVVAPRDPEVGEERLLTFSSGYVLRALDRLPKQGDREPWKLRQNYLYDVRSLRHAALDDGVLRFA